MPTGSELLKQAYALAESGKIDSAIRVLELIVKAEPQRVEAWEFYLQLCTSKQQLTRIAKRISSNTKIDPDDKKDVLRYYQFLLEGKKESKPDPGVNRNRQFYWYIIPAVFICILIYLSAGKISQYFDFTQRLSGIIVFIIALAIALYFLRTMYVQGGDARKQTSRRYAKTVDRPKLKLESKRSKKVK